MKGPDFIVHRLQCAHCGAELPVMGRSVTFRCGTCRLLWAASGDRLRQVRIDRALLTGRDPSAPSAGDRLHLPFWVAEIDLPRLGSDVAGLMRSLRETGARLAEASLAPADGEPDPLMELGMELIGAGTGSGEGRAVPDAAPAVPPQAELDHFMRKISERGVYRVFVPAFDAPGEQVRLSVGRLMTQRQPELRTGPSDGSGPTAIPVVPPGEALVLARYVFFCVLPASTSSCPAFMDRLEVQFDGEPRLVELPFVRHGGEIESLLGGFHIAARLLGSPGEETSPETAKVLFPSQFE